MTDTLDALIQSDSEGMQPAQMLELQRRIAAERYYLAPIVAHAKREWMQAEVDRKTLFAKAKLRAKADHQGPKAMSVDAANDAAEQMPDVIRAKANEIDKDAGFQVLRLKYDASGEVLQSLTMRISQAKEELKGSRTFQHT